MKPTLALSAAVAVFLFAAPSWAQTTAPVAGGNAGATVSGQLPATGLGANGNADVAIGAPAGQSSSAPNGTLANGGTSGTGTGGSTGGSPAH